MLDSYNGFWLTLLAPPPGNPLSGVKLSSSVELSMTSLGASSSGASAFGTASVALTQGETGSRVRSSSARLPFLDFLRAIASQLIVWHHLSFYGPLPDHAYPAAPMLLEWLARYARMGVQVFFVLGGFLTARSLSRSRAFKAKSVASTIWSRYRRIGLPYLASLGVAIGANALARHWIMDEAISAPPTLGQLLAHAAFLHDILGYPALTAGIWYLAIDFQLFLLSLGLFWAAQSWLQRRGNCTNQRALRLLLQWLSPLALASLFWFNRHPQFDAWAIYFVGSYFLGFLLHELLEGRVKMTWAIAYFGLVIVAAIVNPRPRLFVAAATTLIVYAAARTGIMQQWPKSTVVNYFGRISYSLFLIHFPVLLVINAWGAQRLTTSTSMAVAGLLLAYALSLVAGILLYHGIENRIR